MEDRELRNNKISDENPNMKFIVRLYDGFDYEWIDITDPLFLEDARKVWMEKTENGIKHTKYEHIDYYDIFPEDTVMIYSVERKSRRKL